MSPGEIFNVLAYGVGAGVFYWAAQQRRLATDGIFVVSAVGLVCGILGAKLTQLIAEGWPVRVPFNVLLNPALGGRALLGGLICGWVGIEITKRLMGIRRSTGDMFAVALPAGEAVGRIGCYFNGCCYGVKCNLPWAVYQHGEWRHPTQIYSSITSAGIFFWLLWVAKKRGTFSPGFAREGKLFRLYLIGFGITRFLIEFLRWRETLILGLSPMQWFCLEIAVLGLIASVRASRVNHSQPASD